MRRSLGGAGAALVALAACSAGGGFQQGNPELDAAVSDAGRDGAPSDASDGAVAGDASAADSAVDAAGDAAADSAVDAGPPGAMPFAEVAAAAGITGRQWIRPDVDWCWLPLLVCEAPLFTGGAAAGDFDGDGWPDLFVTRVDAPDQLFRNRGDGTFEEVGAAAGVQTVTYSNGASWVDVNDDGHLDLAVSTIGDTRFHLFINQGDGTFEEEAVPRGFALETGLIHLGTGMCFGDYDLDGWVDAFTGQWGAVFDPEQDERIHARVLRNEGHVNPGAFADMTEAAGVVLPLLIDRFPVLFTPSMMDMDGDGWPDLILVSDFDLTRLYWNGADGTFVDATGSLGGDIPDDENGMGLAVGDYDGDGLLDWFVTSIHEEEKSCGGCNWGISGNRLYRNLGARTFEDATDVAGVREGGWGWGALFLDYDHDGDLDLMMANGHVDGTSSQAAAFWSDPVRMWRNEGPGAMTEVAADLGIDDTGATRAIIAFDYDGDGDLDLFITRTADTPLLYRNDEAADGGWLKVRLHGRGAAEGGTNRFGLGARITVRITPESPPMTGHIGQCGYLTQSVLPAHFGVGGAEVVHEVRVWWPVTGHESVHEDVAVNTLLDVYEPAGLAPAEG
jgi:enediyne biosynthesis protein E4